MNRNPIFAVGFGLLLGVGLLTPSCGGSEDLPKLDAGKDVGSTGGARTGGTTGAGGQTGVGGAMATGGATTAMDGGSDARLDVARLDVARLDVARLDVARLDVRRDVPPGDSLPDAPIIKKDGPTKLDTGALDTGIDSPPVTLDTAIDESAADAEAVDAEEIDTSGLDTGID